MTLPVLSIETMQATFDPRASSPLVPTIEQEATRILHVHGWDLDLALEAAVLHLVGCVPGDRRARHWRDVCFLLVMLADRPTLRERSAA